MGMRLSRPPMGKFWMDRWVCAPQSEPGGMEREPMESDSMRVGSCAMVVVAASSDEGVDGSGRMEERTPGVNVAGAKTCFIMVIRLISLHCYLILCYCSATDSSLLLAGRFLQKPCTLRRNQYEILRAL